MSTGIATRAPRQRRRHAPLAFALLFALVAPGVALAETAKEKELEARIAQLEQLVQQLVAQQQQVQTQVADVQAKQAQPVAASDKPAATTATIQTTPIQPSANPGTRFSYGGFIKLDAMFTDTTDGEIADSSAGRTFYLPSAIPVGGASEPGTDADFHAQFSRFWFASDTDLDGHKLKGYLEFDLFGGTLGNETATNTYGATVRHAYVSWDKWLAGQTWSNFQDVAALPDAVDFIGPTEGTTFVRQAQVRYTHGPWSFSAENPETVLTPYLGNAGRISSDDGAMPDLTARYTMKGDWGHFGVGVLARQLRYATSTGIDSDSTGYGVSVSGKFNLGTSDDIRYMATAGSGIGRYIGLGLSNDGVLDAGNEIENIDLTAGFVAWRHVFSPKLRSNLFYSMAHYDNDKALTGLGITERSQSWHGNLIYSPFPKLDIGAELIWGQRSLEGEADGDLRRLHTHVKYSF